MTNVKRKKTSKATMEPSHGCRTWTINHPAHAHHHHFHCPCHHHHFPCPCHHHHHYQHRPMFIFPHHHHLIICPTHHHHHHHYLNYHSNVNASFASPPLQNSEPVGAFPLQKESNLEDGDIGIKDDPDYDTQMLEEQEDEGEFEEPVFVLTDEWREFFAASEARRKMEKQQTRKK